MIRKLMLTIEYVITVKFADDFCKNDEAFINFIAVDTNLKPSINKGKKIITDTNTNLTVSYTLKVGEINEKRERYFNLKMSCDESDKYEDFSRLARKIRLICERINPNNTEINTVRDDVGSLYSCLAYPKIHELENEMRRLISKFMIINVGMSWVKDALHTDIKTSASNKSNKERITDFLQSIDFIELSYVLFKQYRNNSINAIDEYIFKLNSIDSVALDYLKNSLPKSNWERYFSNIIDIDGADLQNKWLKLYDIRNDVAHNRYLSKERFDELQKLIDKISPQLNKALEHLDSIKLTESDVSLITNSLETSTDYKPIILIKAIKELNIGMATAVEFLAKKGHFIDKNPMAKLSEEMHQLLKAEYLS